MKRKINIPTLILISLLAAVLGFLAARFLFPPRYLNNPSPTDYIDQLVDSNTIATKFGTYNRRYKDDLETRVRNYSVYDEVPLGLIEYMKTRFDHSGKQAAKLIIRKGESNTGGSGYSTYLYLLDDQNRPNGTIQVFNDLQRCPHNCLHEAFAGDTGGL